MKFQRWKNLWFAILLVVSIPSCCFSRFNRAWSIGANLKDIPEKSIPEKSKTASPSLAAKVTSLGCGRQESGCTDAKLQRARLCDSTNTNSTTNGASKLLLVHAAAPCLCLSKKTSHPIKIQAKSICKKFPDSEVRNSYSQALPVDTSEPLPKSNPNNNQAEDEPPQLEVPLIEPSSTQIQQKLKTPEEDRNSRLERLLLRLQQNRQPSSESIIDEELGKLKLREIPLPLEQLQTPPLKKPVAKFRPVGYLKAYVSYFQTSNIFSSKKDPIEDSLIFSGLTLASMPLRLGRDTYLNGSVDGALFRYLNQSKYNYNQVRFNFSIYQQLTRRMYGEIGWSNQQLFYARDGDFFKAGDRFLNENSLRLSLGRRDSLGPKLILDSYYEFLLGFTNQQEKRSRVSNFLWLSLNYYLQSNLQVGLDYQFGFSDFTQRDREDLYHRFYGHLNYRISDYTNINLQAGVTLGNSTDPYINFDGWFFSVNYNLLVGQF
jgi:hypothetical protein